MSAIAGQHSAFEADVTAYLKALPAQLSRNEGKFALVGQGSFFGVYASQDDAMAAGYRQFGINGFLVQEITRFDMEVGQHWLDSCES